MLGTADRGSANVVVIGVGLDGTETAEFLAQARRQAPQGAKGQVADLYLIGDGRQSGMIVDATLAGYTTATAL
jgi:hypothetical protein